MTFHMSSPSACAVMKKWLDVVHVSVLGEYNHSRSGDSSVEEATRVRKCGRTQVAFQDFLFYFPLPFLEYSLVFVIFLFR